MQNKRKMSTQKNNDVGKQGEELALRYLRGQGYQVLHCNWKGGRNEIDIIVKEGNTTIFVEVKARTTDNTGHPEQFVTAAKQREIKKAAEIYLFENETDKIRFDVIAITYWPGADTEIMHFEDAFF
jgi:putative endonuclease